ncbi:RICIN domain-containing protein [Amycolatopsis sp. H20-H5]|uniref:RICIN domain-containing protein n=1 Tax=Amycolatopsis sp. H20-H5 TaxID=3046309 RepID=UPI002DBB9715|nr:RICIN domain-containing protein [Amycolatopsis sp. H20-H5]MEC3978218.1 RICIN domain-containing protein [Amycolatopsis sp. H20-H5]
MITALVAVGVLAPPAAWAAPPAADYTITVDATKAYAYPTDTPAAPYLDKDGTFYFQQSEANYGVQSNRVWDFYTGKDFDSATKSASISNAVNPANPQDKNNDTTWRCNNSPTGRQATDPPAGSGYSQKNFCDLVGVWVDPDTGDWYGLVHNEFTPEPFGANSFSHYDAIDYATSTNQGKTWTIKDHVITSPHSTARGDTTAFPNETFDYGDGDPRLFVDQASGYFYVYYASRIVPKAGTPGKFTGLAHVARAPMSSKLATGSWSKWYDGSWSQPGVGGRESNMVPATSSAPSGYTPVAKDYNPADKGSVDEQIAAGTVPVKSDLFVMNIAYDAHLGLYLGEPEAVSGAAPQRYYVTDNLATQQWHLIGDSGAYKSESWYRWFLDGANKTNSMIIGKTFRSYCAFSCATSDGEYATETITSTAPAGSPLDPAKTYRIGSGGGRVFAQVQGGSATQSLSAPTGSALEAWSFDGNGDGSYRITNAATGRLLGVDSTSISQRAWGTKPTVTASGPGGPTPGQQWFVLANTSQSGTYRLVNRYSGLVLGLSSAQDRSAETTPTRSWTDTSGNPVGGSRSAAEQTLTLTDAGSPANLNGTHTVSASGQALDVPDFSTSAGTQLDTWAPNGGANQNWVFTRQADGSYTIASAHSGLCMDDDGGFTTPGTAVIQWTCTGGDNQHWTVAASAGRYTITNVHSGLRLTTASTADGALVAQQENTGSALRQWTVS